MATELAEILKLKRRKNPFSRALSRLTGSLLPVVATSGSRSALFLLTRLTGTLFLLTNPTGALLGALSSALFFYIFAFTSGSSSAKCLASASVSQTKLQIPLPSLVV